MTEWETEDERAGNPVMTRSSSRSAKASRRRSRTPPNRSNSPALADKAAKRSSRDMAMDEKISILDPRRFTPTLHANLVAEILTLRRDQEDKIRLIETLETSLFSTKEEHESLQQSHSEMAKESRSLKRQLSLLEGGTSSALGELARERDEAVDSITETKKRLEAAQKKVRSQEDDSQRVHDQWAKEKNEWEEEKRKFERKIHVSETRLKAILEEVAAYQSAQANGLDLEEDMEDTPREHDVASIRTMSMTGSLRYSLVNSPTPANSNGACLADELNMDDDDSDAAATESVFSSPRHRRTVSRETAPFSRMHRRDLSMESLNRPGSAARSRLFFNPNVLGILQGEDEEPAETPRQPPASYTDTGIQFSPPPSPKMEPVSKPATPDFENVPRLDNEIEANQRRKRVSKPVVLEPVAPRSMVSAAAQTIETPLSPPRTPKMNFEPVTPPPETAEPPVMVSSETQTENTEPELPVLNVIPPMTPTIPTMLIPSISVQPPTSRPTTPRHSILPPYMKNFGCQVNISYQVPMTESSVQTEGIQVDKRLASLPAHLRPSAISSRPTSPAKDNEEGDKSFTPVPGNLPPRNPRRLVSKSLRDLQSSPISLAGSEDILDSHLGSEDVEATGLKAPRRTGSFFAGFESASSDEAEEFGEAEASDSEYRTALSAPRPPPTTNRTTKRGSFGTATSPEQFGSRPPVRGAAKLFGTDVFNSLSKVDTEGRGHGRTLSKTLERSNAIGSRSRRSSDIRKHAMIQGSIASQQTRSRSPSLPDGPNPPFPIPLRDSSKRLSSSFMSTPSEDHSPTRMGSWHRRGSSRNSYYGSSVRRVRSAQAMPRPHRNRRHGSRSPPPLSVSTEAPESPGLPPLPRNDITTPRSNQPSSSYRRHRHELSTNTDNTLNTDPMSTSQASGQNSVVDAIAQTMVGEWMFKYVRRRKSFSVPDANSKDDTGNDRHKRWVWLAPYERSILWSSKQPSSGSALMGKTGRKRKLFLLFILEITQCLLVWLFGVLG